MMSHKCQQTRPDRSDDDNMSIRRARELTSATPKTCSFAPLDGVARTRRMTRAAATSSAPDVTMSDESGDDERVRKIHVLMRVRACARQHRDEARCHVARIKASTLLIAAHSSARLHATHATTALSCPSHTCLLLDVVRHDSNHWLLQCLDFNRHVDFL